MIYVVDKQLHLFGCCYLTYLSCSPLSWMKHLGESKRISPSFNLTLCCQEAKISLT